MKRTTKEMELELLESNIIWIKHRADCKGFTMKDTIRVVEKIDELCNLNTKLKGSLTYVAPFYIKKEILNYHMGNVNEALIATALVCPSFTSKYIASLVIKIGNRFSGYNDRRITKTFRNEEEAMKWLRKLLNK